MSKLFMLAGGIVERGSGAPAAVSAYVAFHPGPGKSRLFKVQGPADNPVVSELDSATTVDLGRFERELQADLAPALEEIRRQGGAGAAAIAKPKAAWVAEMVARHLRDAEGVAVE